MKRRVKVFGEEEKASIYKGTVYPCLSVGTSAMNTDQADKILIDI